MKLRGALGSVFALLLASGISPWGITRSAAAPSAVQEAEDADADAALDALLDQVYAEPKKAIPRLNKLVERAEPSVRSYLLGLRGAAYLIDGKVERAEQDFAEAHRLDPVSEFPSLNRFFAGLNAEHVEQSSKGLDELIAVAPDRVRGIEIGTMFSYLRSNKSDHADDQRIALAELGFGGLDGLYITRAAIEVLLRRGETAKATGLLDRIKDAALFQDMLVDRTFAPVWPSLESRAGPGMTSIGNAAIEAAENSYRANPQDVPGQRRLIEAYSALRRFDDADRIGLQFASSPEQLKSIDEDGGWLINAHVYALHDAGRKDEAQQRFGSLIGVKIHEGWIISMIINQLELVVREKKFSDAERMLPVAESQVVTKGSPYAKQLVRRLRLCNMAGLGRPTANLIDEFKKHEDDAAGASVEGYMCIDHKVDAKRVVLKMLANKDDASRALISLQKERLISTDPSIWEGYWAALREDPEVEEAFQRVGRDLPEQFLVK